MVQRSSWGLKSLLCAMHGMNGQQEVVCMSEGVSVERGYPVHVVSGAVLCTDIPNDIQLLHDGFQCVFAECFRVIASLCSRWCH